LKSTAIPFPIAFLTILLGLLVIVACGSSSTDAIRAEQVVRDAVVPNVQAISNAANGSIAQYVGMFGLAQFWYVRYELMDWQVERTGSKQYRVQVTVNYLDDCRPEDVPACTMQRQIGLSENFRIDGCDSPAEFQVLLDEPVTIVPKNTCAENIYYLPSR
jgi:hypothetical protein